MANTFNGRITQITIDVDSDPPSNFVQFVLDPPVAFMNQTFVLKTTHPNYPSIFSLILACSVNGQQVRVATQNDLPTEPTEFGEVGFVVGVF